MANDGAGGPLIDPLLESFADRYVEPWGSRELPIDLAPQLDDAADLFERGRWRWFAFDIQSNGAGSPALVERDFEGKEWPAEKVVAARSAHRFLHTSYDLSKPDELWLGDLRESLEGAIPDAVLYASVAMRCAVDAADGCYQFSRIVDEYAGRARKVAQSDLADEIAEAREFVATCLGAARTALALASAAENAAKRDEAERDYVALWEQHEANKRAVLADVGALDRSAPESEYFSALPVDFPKPSPEFEAALAEKAELKKESIERLRQEKENTAAATEGKIRRGRVTEASVKLEFSKTRTAHPRWSDDQVCEEVGRLLYVHKTTVRIHAGALSLLGKRVADKISLKTVRNSNTPT